MEALVLLLLAFLLLLVWGAVAGIVARRHAAGLADEVERLQRDLRELRAEVRASAPKPPAVEPAPAAAERPDPAHPAAPATPALAPTPVPEPPAPPKPIPLAVVPPAAPAPLPAAPPPLPRPQQPPAPPPAPKAAPAAFDAVEASLGMRWLVWVGTALLFLGIAFFLKYAYDRDWLGRFFGPRLRIATAATAAFALAAAGWRSLRREMPALGQALLGGGQALLYLTVFAAFQPAAFVVDEPLLGPTTAFLLMAAITATGLAAAVRLDAVAMAFLAVLGGLATPVMVGRGEDARDVLFAYLLLLDLGVLGVALHRRWRALDVLAFVGTALLFGGWFARFYAAHPQPDPPTLVWLCTFHLVFLLVPFVHHYRHRTPVAVERFVLALGNVAWAIAYATEMLHHEAPLLLGSLCALGAGLYLGLGVLLARRAGGDRRTVDGCVGLAVLLLALALLHLLPERGVSVGFHAEAVAVLWFGYRFANARVRVFAHLVLVAALVRSCLTELLAYSPEPALFTDGWFLSLLVAGAGLGAFGWLHARFAASTLERWLSRGFGIGAGWWVLWAGCLEITRHAHTSRDAWGTLRAPLGIAWLLFAGTLAFVAWAVRRPHRATVVGALLPLSFGLFATALAYDSYPADALAVWNARALTGLLGLAVTAATAALANRAGHADARGPLFGTTQLGLAALATLETVAWLQRGGATPAPSTLGQALTIVWLALAAGGLAAAAAARSRRVFLLATLPLAAAALASFWHFGHRLSPHRLVVNVRCVAAFACSTAVAVCGRIARRLGLAPIATATPAAALLLSLAYGAAEAITWSLDERHGDAGWLCWLLGVVALTGAIGGGVCSARNGDAAQRAVARAALLPGALLPLAVYATGWPVGWMFLNARAALVAVAVLTLVAGSRRGRGGMLRWAAFGIAFVGLSSEPPVWLLAHVADRTEAERLALFSVTLVWVATAVALLVRGFARNLRPVRLTALALFALTAAKLLLVDMSGAQQLYRILAFVVTGLVLIGASWLYHRVERRLSAPRQ